VGVIHNEGRLKSPINYGSGSLLDILAAIEKHVIKYIFDLSDRIKIIRIHKNFFSNFFKSVVHRKEPELIISAPGGNLISAPRLGTTLVKEVKNMELLFKKFFRIFDKIKRIKIFPTDVGIHN